MAVDTNVDAEFGQFVVLHSPALFQVAYALTGDARAAEDLVERALAKAFVRWRRIHDQAEPYVKRTIYRDSASRSRRRSDRAESATLRSALLGLPPRQRAVLVLRYLEDLSVEATAEFLGWRPGTVASQTDRARATLRDLISADARTTEVVDIQLRGLIHNLAAEGDLVRPERDRRGFALDATDRGYQYRNRRRASLASAVVAVIALGLGVPYGLTLTRAGDGRGIHPASSPTGGAVIGRDGVPTQVITDKTRPIELVDGWYVAGSKFVLDWPHKTYRRMSGDSIQLSPNGEWVVTKDVPLDFTSITYRVTNLHTGNTHNYVHRRVIDEPQWSPDGNRLLLSKTPEGEPPTRTLVAVMLDVTTGTTSASMLDVTGLNCAEVGGCRLTWLPSGTEIAITVSRTAGANQPFVPSGVQTFTLDGARARLLPIAGISAGPQSWSPDGRHVVVHALSADGLNPEVQLVEVATGTVVRPMPGLVMQAAWVDNDRMLIWEVDVTEPDKPALVVTLQTRDSEVLQRWQPPAEIFERSGFGAVGPFAVRLGT